MGIVVNTKFSDHQNIIFQWRSLSPPFSRIGPIVDAHLAWTCAGIYWYLFRLCSPRVVCSLAIPLDDVRVVVCRRVVSILHDIVDL